MDGHVLRHHLHNAIQAVQFFYPLPLHSQIELKSKEKHTALTPAAQLFWRRTSPTATMTATRTMSATETYTQGVFS